MFYNIFFSKSNMKSNASVFLIHHYPLYDPLYFYRDDSFFWHPGKESKFIVQMPLTSIFAKVSSKPAELNEAIRIKALKWNAWEGKKLHEARIWFRFFHDTSRGYKVFEKTTLLVHITALDDLSLSINHFAFIWPSK